MRKQVGADRARKAGGDDLHEFHKEAREVGNLARHWNSLSEGTRGKFQRLPKADSGHEPREKVTILRKNLSPMAFAHTMPAPRADVRSS
jgi:hypothetical protein